jgi:hypothetical protein
MAHITEPETVASPDPSVDWPAPPPETRTVPESGVAGASVKRLSRSKPDAKAAAEKRKRHNGTRHHGARDRQGKVTKRPPTGFVHTPEAMQPTTGPGALERCLVGTRWAGASSNLAAMQTSSPPTLEDAIALALKVHEGVKDRGGQPYILHPLRLMVRMGTEAERMAAVLHDVVEDDTRYGTTLATLRQAGYPEAVVGAVECLTKREGEDYADFIERAKSNPIARRVKLADLEDNLDVRRLPAVTPKDAERFEKYRRAWRVLQEG